MSGVVVLGSANGDLVLTMPRLPTPGETVLATGTTRVPGGKGANQAAAAARAGAGTVMLGALGDDAEAAALRPALSDAGVDITALRTSSESTGLAVVMVDEAGQNSIVVAPGANATMTSLTEGECDVLRGASVLLCQLEVPIGVVVDAAVIARESGARVVLNAAPSRALPEEMWPLLDVLVVNEHEAADLTGSAATVEEVGETLLQRVPCVIVTLGRDGAWLGDRDGTRRTVPAPRVQTVDTTAAGDTFCGVLAAALAEGSAAADALPRAVVAASLSVQRRGAIPSTPTAAEIDAALREVAQ